MRAAAALDAEAALDAHRSSGVTGSRRTAGEWSGVVKRSRSLKALTPAPTGGVVAAPTSLPGSSAAFN
jgi:hypothetical protein